MYLLHNMTYAPVRFEIAMPNGSGEEAFTRKCIVQCPPNYITYAPAKFEVATSNRLEDTFTRKYII